MTKNPELLEKLHAGQWNEIRKAAVEQGVNADDVAETVVEEAHVRLADGDDIGADAVLFHAVHAGIAPSRLFTSIRKRYE
jgi:hypothetical protein